MSKQRILGPRPLWAECREKTRHLRLRGDVEAYADGELSDVHRIRMAAHIAGCWACSGSLQLLQLIKTSLQDSPRRTPASLASARMRRYAHRLTAPPGPDL